MFENKSDSWVKKPKCKIGECADVPKYKNQSLFTFWVAVGKQILLGVGTNQENTVRFIVCPVRKPLTVMN